MNMIEKVARAIDKAGQKSSETEGLIGVGLCFDEKGSKENQRLMMDLAKAAIEAMLEPTDEMLKAADNHAHSYDAGSRIIKDGYKLMIQAALKE